MRIKKNIDLKILFTQPNSQEFVGTTLYLGLGEKVVALFFTALVCRFNHGKMTELIHEVD